MNDNQAFSSNNKKENRVKLRDILSQEIPND